MKVHRNQGTGIGWPKSGSYICLWH